MPKINKVVAIIVIALAALGAVTGLLALLASSNVNLGPLNALSFLTSPGGISLLAISSAILSYAVYCLISPSCSPDEDSRARGRGNGDDNRNVVIERRPGIVNVQAVEQNLNAPPVNNLQPNLNAPPVSNDSEDSSDDNNVDVPVVNNRQNILLSGDIPQYANLITYALGVNQILIQVKPEHPKNHPLFHLGKLASLIPIDRNVLQNFDMSQTTEVNFLTANFNRDQVTDYGGPSRQFLAILFEGIASCNELRFLKCASSQLLYPTLLTISSERQLEAFRLMGRTIVFCCYGRNPIGNYFDLSMYGVALAFTKNELSMPYENLTPERKCELYKYHFGFRNQEIPLSILLFEKEIWNYSDLKQILRMIPREKRQILEGLINQKKTQEMRRLRDEGSRAPTIKKTLRSELRKIEGNQEASKLAEMKVWNKHDLGRAKELVPHFNDLYLGQMRQTLHNIKSPEAIRLREKEIWDEEDIKSAKKLIPTLCNLLRAQLEEYNCAQGNIFLKKEKWVKSDIERASEICFNKKPIAEDMNPAEIRRLLRDACIIIECDYLLTPLHALATGFHEFTSLLNTTFIRNPDILEKYVPSIDCGLDVGSIFSRREQLRGDEENYDSYFYNIDKECVVYKSLNKFFCEIQGDKEIRFELSINMHTVKESVLKVVRYFRGHQNLQIFIPEELGLCKIKNWILNGLPNTYYYSISPIDVLACKNLLEVNFLEEDLSTEYESLRTFAGKWEITKDRIDVLTNWLAESATDEEKKQFTKFATGAFYLKPYSSIKINIVSRLNDIMIGHTCNMSVDVGLEGPYLDLNNEDFIGSIKGIIEGEGFNRY